MSSREMDMLIDLLGLKTLIGEDRNPKVFHYLEEFSSHLYKTYPMLYMVGSQDLTELLPPPYYQRLETCVYTIAYYLAECRNKAHEENPPPLPSEAFNELEKYLKIMCQIEENNRRDAAAIETISPPFTDANKYLNEDEYKSFQNSLSDAVDAYFNQSKMEKLYCPELWLEYSQEYTRWLSIIQSRKGKAANSKGAQVEYEQYMNSVKRLLSEVKTWLTTEKPPRFIYPKTIKPYMPDHWCELELPVKQEVQDWAKIKIKEIVPTEVVDFIKWKYSHKILTLPTASYQMLGIPCLTWTFTVRLLVTLNLYVTGEAVYKHFRSISYPVKLPNEELGYYYLGPVEWGDTLEGFSTPITLLVMLSEGKIEHDGVEIIAHDSPLTVYEVEGYDGDSVEIHDLFRKFIVDITKGKSLSHGLLAAGLVDELTASLVDAKTNIPLPHKGNSQPKMDSNADDTGDVRAALEALGYKKDEISQMIAATQFPLGMSLEEKLQAALKMLGT